MSEQMEFPNTFDEFAKEYGFTDTEEIYTNGSDLIPVFRVKQWLKHTKTQMIDKSNFDERQYKVDMDTAYQCGYSEAMSVIEDIKAEIKAVAYDDFTATDGLTECWICNLDEVLEIIDKHISGKEK